MNNKFIDNLSEDELVILMKDVKDPIKINDDWIYVIPLKNLHNLESYQKDKDYYYNQTEKEAKDHYKSNGEGNR